MKRLWGEWGGRNGGGTVFLFPVIYRAGCPWLLELEMESPTTTSLPWHGSHRLRMGGTPHGEASQNLDSIFSCQFLTSTFLLTPLGFHTPATSMVES